MTQTQSPLSPSGLSILASLVLCILMIAGLGLAPLGSSSFLFESVKSTGHFLCFGLLACLVALATPLVWPPSVRSHWRPLAIGFGFSVLAGGLLEVAQKFCPPRSASWWDLALDALGALAAICLLHLVNFPTASGERLRRGRWASLFLLLAATTLACAPLVNCLLDYGRRNHAFPVLVDFRASWSRRFLKVAETVQLTPTTAPADWAADAGKNVARLRIGTGQQYPGWGMEEPYPSWPVDADLAFDVLLSSHDKLPLVLRVHDAQHNHDHYDRFNCTLNLVRGFQQVRIPVQAIRDGPRLRKLDLTRVRAFKLFAVAPTTPVEMTIGNVRLEKN